MLVMSWWYFCFCLGFSVGRERSVDFVNGSYSHRLKPKDENLSDFFVTVFTNLSPCPGRNSCSLCVYPCILIKVVFFFLILSQLSDETFPGATAVPSLLGDDKWCMYSIWGTVWVNSLYSYCMQLLQLWSLSNSRNYNLWEYPNALFRLQVIPCYSSLIGSSWCWEKV